MNRSFMLASLLVLAACSASPEELRQEAEAAYARHDYTAARLHLAKALQGDPANRALLLLQAKTLLALGDGDGAGAAIDRLTGGNRPEGDLSELAAEAALLRGKPEVAEDLLKGSGTVEADRLRAMAAMQRGNADAARAALERAIGAGGSARAFADMARREMLAGDLDKASRNLARAEDMDPRAIPVLLTGGELATRQGDLGKALALYEKALKGYPGNSAAMAGKAATLGDLGRLEEMETALEPLARAAPSDPAVSYLRARLALARKNWAEVRELIQPIEAQLAAQDARRLLYGEALLRLGQAEQARAQVVAIARAQPGNRHAAMLLAESLLAVGDARAAAAVLRPIAVNPEARPEEIALMARIAAASGDPAVKDLSARARRPAPQALAADLAEGDAAMRGGNWARAVTAYDRILAVTDGRNVMVLNNMAYAQSMLGNHDKARAFADRAMTLAPGNASVLDTAGWVRWRSGRDHEEARRLLRLAAEKAPDNGTIRAHLAETEGAGR